MIYCYSIRGEKMYYDKNYLNIIDHILKNDEFNKLKEIEHHGTTRYDHSIKVSYYSYKLAKFLKLNYKATAKAGLLHDFFISDKNRTPKDKIKSTFVHPKYALEKASEEFDLEKIEKDIIRTHMFPINLALPKYAESWLVSFVDKVVGTKEFCHKFKYKLSYATNLYIIFLINFIK